MPGTVYKSRLAPYRNVAPHNILENNYSIALNETIDAGVLVKCAEATLDNPYGYSSTAVGTNYDGVTSNRFETANKLAAADAGDDKFVVLGLTAYGAADTDPNGNPLIWNQRRKEELRLVLPGEAMPIITKGQVALYASAVVGTPEAGFVGVPASDGRIEAVDPSTVTDKEQIVGKFLTSEGEGGYSIFALDV